MLNIALFGAPGAGKGTQAKKIVEKFGLVHLSTGDMIRAEIAKGSELGKMAEGIIAGGNLLSDEFVISLIENSISNHESAKGFLFDGFPRTVAQAERLDAMLEKLGSPLNGLVNIVVPFEELKQRMLKRAALEGRADDNETAIENRFVEYREKTVKVSEYYQAKNLRFDVKGDGTMDEVFAAICQEIEKM